MGKQPNSHAQRYQPNSSGRISFTIKKDAQNNAQKPNAEGPQPRSDVDDGKIPHRVAIYSSHLPAYTVAAGPLAQSVAMARHQPNHHSQGGQHRHKVGGGRVVVFWRRVAGKQAYSHAQRHQPKHPFA